MGRPKGRRPLGRPGASAPRRFLRAFSPAPRPNAARGHLQKNAQGGFSSALLDLRGVRNCLLLSGNAHPIGHTVKGGRSCLARQGRPNCVRIILSPYTPTLCDRGAPVKNAPDGIFPAHCRIKICRKRMEPSPPAQYARPVGYTVEGAGSSFQNRPRHVNTAPSPTPRLNTTGARLQKSALGEGPPARRLIWTYERGKVVPPT